MPFDQAARELGVDRRAPLLGYIFSQSWADQNPGVAAGFVRASRAAKKILAEDDGEWEILRERTRAKDDETLRIFRDRFREGIPQTFGDAEIAAARELYRILAAVGGEKLVGESETLAAGTFWRGARF